MDEALRLADQASPDKLCKTRQAVQATSILMDVFHIVIAN